MQVEMREGTEAGIELFAVEGSHLYVRSVSGADVFLEWSELNEGEKKEALKVRELEKSLSAAIDGLYWTLAGGEEKS